MKNTRNLKTQTYNNFWWPVCETNQITHAHSLKNTRKNQQNKKIHIVTNGGLHAQTIKGPMHIASKTQKNQKTNTYTN